MGFGTNWHMALKARATGLRKGKFLFSWVRFFVFYKHKDGKAFNDMPVSALRDWICSLRFGGSGLLEA